MRAVLISHPYIIIDGLRIRILLTILLLNHLPLLSLSQILQSRTPSHPPPWSASSLFPARSLPLSPREWCKVRVGEQIIVSARQFAQLLQREKSVSGSTG